MLGMDTELLATKRGVGVWLIGLFLMWRGGVILLIFAAIPLIVGIGLWQLKNWARIVTIMFTGLGLLTWLSGQVGSVVVNLPMEFDPLSLIELGISAWTLWYLSRPLVKGAFDVRARTPGFYMEGRRAALINAFRPTWSKVGVSLLAALSLGGGGLFLYFTGICWFGGHDCAAYSPSRIFLAYVLSLPIFLMQKIFFGSVENVTNFGPVVFGKSGWVAVLIYYYLLVSVADHFIRRR